MDSSKLRRRLGRPGVIAISIAVLLVSSVIQAAASHGLATLSGSNFEIDNDANLKNDDGAPFVDWADLAHPNGPELRATDAATGQNDDSYQGGSKEDTQCPGEVTGSIPNNKSDLLTFHVFEEPGTAGHPGFLNLAWSRVSDPSGTTLMDFEFNQSDEDCSTGPNKVRTAGDLLIEYAIDQGGAQAEISGRFWTGSAWGPAQDLDDSTACGGGPCAVGTINQTAIPAADSDGLGDKQPRTFGEAQIDLRLIFDPTECASFGSAMLKSRSSDAFNSQLKDFIRPVSIDLQNCGNVIIRKQTDPDEDPNVTEFGYTKSFNTFPASPDTFTLVDDGVQDYNDTVLFGTNYTVTEDVIPPNWEFVSVDCSASSGVTADTSAAPLVTFDIDADSDVLDCTYTNKLNLGAIKVTKTSSKTGNALAGAQFSVTGPGGFSTTLTTGSDGTDCVDGLAFGDYTVTETAAPPGFVIDDPAGRTVTVGGDNATCEDDPYVGESESFTDTPTADIQVRFRDGGSGETHLQDGTELDCNNPTGTDDPADTTGWDDTLTVNGIEIDSNTVTVTCTIVIDP